MVDTVQFILRLSYYYARFLGVLNFEIDVKTGLARITRVSAIYAVLANGFVCVLLASLGRSTLVARLWTNAGLLHEYLFLAVHGTRCTCMVATMLSRWCQRQELVRLVNDFRRLAFKKPEVMRMWRRGVIYKTVGNILSEVVQIVFGTLALWRYLTLTLAMNILVLFSMTIIVNEIISHNYFAILNVRCHYILLNQEIETVFHEIRFLENGHRRAAFMIKCCTLADQLEDIARAQSEIQRLFGKITHIFGIQVLCVTLSSYMSIIASVYYTYSEIKMNMNGSKDLLYIFIYVIQIVIYYGDIMLTVRNVFDLLDDHSKLVELLNQSSNFAPGLDKRLETVIKSFQLQLARNPLKAPALGLYNMERTNIITLASSLVTHSLVLIQNDMENAIDSKAPNL